MSEMPNATISRAYRMRVYPTAAQSALLGRLFGAARFVWNWALATRTAAWREREERVNWIGLSRQFTELRRAADTAWLGELPREPFNQVLRDQERAFGNFFSKRAAYPRFKRRGGHASVRFTFDQRRAQVQQGAGRFATVELPGLGAVKLRQTEALSGRLRSVTISRDGAGRVFAAITADGVPVAEPLAATIEAVGLDAGLRDLLVIAGDAGALRRVEAPKALSAKLAKLRRYQRRQSRQIAAQMRAQGLDPAKPCPKGVRLGVSGRRRRQQRRIARLHAAIGDTRRDVLHQATNRIVREAQVICLEDLNLKAMSRSMGRRGFRRSVNDAALGEMRRQVEYKAEWQERVVIAVDRFYPSSKTCNNCGAINRALQLREKRWICACGAEHDRDENAAKNLRAEGLRLMRDAGSSPATPRSGESDARGVASAVAAVQNNAPLQHRPTMNRELAVAVPREKAEKPKRAARPRKTRMERVDAGSG